MAPLVKALAAEPGVQSRVCVTGQHQHMLKQVLDLFDLKVDYTLDVMRPNQTLNTLSAALFDAIDPMLDIAQPDRVLVHGDTTTAMVASMAAFHRRIPVGHVEAGLRTGDIRQPWPEEMNRRLLKKFSGQSSVTCWAIQTYSEKRTSPELMTLPGD